MTVSTFTTPLGTIILAAHNGALVYCNWDCEECRPKLKKAAEVWTPHDKDKDRDQQTLRETSKQLEEYFKGKRKCFDLPIVFEGSSFRKRVWEKLIEIGYGNTVTYKELAERCGVKSGFRAVANACGANNVAIIVPCHRVVASSGGIGGYTGGIDKKSSLLELERLFQHRYVSLSRQPTAD